jgi:Xaa-Pro aminopeptidase
MIDQGLIEDLFYRQQQLQKDLRELNSDGIILTSDVNVFYMTGLVFNGYYYLPANGDPFFFVKRPEGLTGDRIFPIRKPEQIPDIINSCSAKMPENIFLETDDISFNEYTRLNSIFNFDRVENASAYLRKMRMIKSPWEISQLRKSAGLHSLTYSKIPSCYRKGMTDLEFQIEIEHQMRLNGSIGSFHTYGPKMNIFMGSLLAGKNAVTPSPFDFALGGGGITPTSPIGANGTLLKEGMTVMIDMAGNYTEYISDMTRTYSIGRVPEIAYRVHDVALEIHGLFENTAKPGTPCADLYNLSHSIASKHGLADYFMGTIQQAKFAGHGIGIEVNEPPVLTYNSKDLLQENMTIAFEPKFVLPNIGAVGIENSFIVTEKGVEKITVFDEEIIPLD